MTKNCQPYKLQRSRILSTSSYLDPKTLDYRKSKVLRMSKKTDHRYTSKLVNFYSIWQTGVQKQLISNQPYISPVSRSKLSSKSLCYKNKARVIATKQHKSSSQYSNNIVYRWFNQDKTIGMGIKKASEIDAKQIQEFFATDAYQAFDKTNTPNTTQAHLSNQNKQQTYPKKKSRLDFFSNPFKGEDTKDNSKASQENGTLAADLIDTNIKEQKFDNDNFEASDSINNSNSLEKKLQDDLRKNHEKIIKHNYGDINLTKASSILKIMYYDISSTLLFKGIIFVAILITALLKIYVTYQATQETINYSKLLADQTSLQHSNQNLQLEFLALTSRSKITNLALNNLNLIPIKNQNEVIVIVPFTKAYLEQQQLDNSTTLPLLNFPTPHNK